MKIFDGKKQRSGLCMFIFELIKDHTGSTRLTQPNLARELYIEKSVTKSNEPAR